MTFCHQHDLVDVLLSSVKKWVDIWKSITNLCEYMKGNNDYW